MKIFDSITAVLILGACSINPALSALDPESETLKISKRLKPISDARWNEIMGANPAQNYNVESGDSLWEISKRLFGDGYYWPKVWAINNGKITNPHLIRPGKQVAFLPGTGSTLPGLTAGGGETILAQSPPSSIDRSGETWKRKSDDWKRLPRQNWESVSIQVPSLVDPQGFDRRSKVISASSSGTLLTTWVESEKLDPIGFVLAANSPANEFVATENIYIEEEEENALRVGDIYTVTAPATTFSGEVTGRSGFVYVNQGKIRITKRTDDVLQAEIIESYMPINRESFLIPEIKTIRERRPIPGPRQIEGAIRIDRSFSGYATAEHKLAFIDRGEDDGVAPGMIFRAYQYTDPNTESDFTESDLVKEADFIVIHVSERFCTVKGIESINPIEDERIVVLLSDVSDVRYNTSSASTSGESTMDSSPLPATPPTGSEEDLDALDDGGELSDDEKKELKQLEDWEKNPEDTAELPEDETEEVDEDEELAEDEEYVDEDSEDAEGDEEDSEEESESPPEDSESSDEGSAAPSIPSSNSTEEEMLMDSAPKRKKDPKSELEDESLGDDKFFDN